LGEKDKVVFWYQDAASKKYRAIYGDLTVRNANPETLPKAPALDPMPAGPVSPDVPKPAEPQRAKLMPAPPPLRADPAKAPRAK